MQTNQRTELKFVTEKAKYWAKLEKSIPGMKTLCGVS